MQKGQEYSNHDLLIKIATDVEWIKKEMEGLKDDVEGLKSFKWKIVGMSTLAAFVISSGIALLSILLG
jgi:hypothetical protein